MGAVFAAAYTLCLITGIIYGFAGSGSLFLREMERFAPAERTGLPEAEYPGMAEHIAAYLTGRKESFQYVFSGPAGESLACFHDYEAAHMEDCRNLIRLDGAVCLGSLGAAAAAAVLLFRRRKRGLAEARRGARDALLAIGLIAAGMLTFHRIAFSNELWLLDPRTDLLIRLMPEGMFMDLGLRGLTAFAAGMTPLAGMMMISRRRIQ